MVSFRNRPGRICGCCHKRIKISTDHIGGEFFNSSDEGIAFSSARGHTIWFCNECWKILIERIKWSLQ